MTSVINSARISTASVFDVITNTTSILTDTITSGQLGMNILHNKVRVAHAASTQNTEKKIAAAKERDLTTMVKEHSEFMVSLESDLAKDPALKAMFATNLKRFTKD